MAVYDLVLTALVAFLRWEEPEKTLKRTKEWIQPYDEDLMNGYNITHVYMTNSWYKYVHMVAKYSNLSNCYVCSIMPLTSSTPRLRVAPFDKITTDCIAIRSSRDWNYTYHSNTTTPNGTWLRDPCSTTHPLVEIKATELVTTHVEITKGMLLPYCFVGNGTVFLGNLTKQMCNQTIVPRWRDPNESNSSTGKMLSTACPWGNNSMCEAWPDDLQFPSPYGTPPLEGVMWLCGHKLYLSLPGNWSGICAPVQVTDHTYVLYAQHQPNSARRRRAVEVKRHDSIWGEDVPNDQKLWTKGRKVTLSLFPWMGVGKVMLRVETMNYRLGLFINATTETVGKLTTEVSNIRTMILQNRLVLDFLTAAKGGVCVMLNDSCCTWIPDDVGTHSVQDALQQMRNVKEAMTNDKITDPGIWNPFDWFSVGTWWQILLKALVIMAVVGILLLCGCMCCLTCFKIILSRFVNNAIQSVMVQQEMEALLSEEDKGETV